MSHLFKIRSFMPFLMVLFLNAFVDLGHKVIIQNTVFKMHDGTTLIILTSIVNALILLPFVFLFSPSGFLSDRFAKPKVMQFSAFAAIVITLIITASYYMGWYEIAFAMTLVLAIQSALYSPAKYGYIKELVGKEQLTLANGVVQMLTIAAILLGIFVFSMLFEHHLANKTYMNEAELLQHIAPIGWILVLCSVIEWLSTTQLVTHHSGDKEKSFKITRYASLGYLKANVQAIHVNRVIWLSIIGLSVFWGISQVMLAAFPALAKETLSETSTVVIQGILAASGIGIAFGSWLAGRLSQHHIETGLIPVGAVGILLSLILLPMLGSVWSYAGLFLILGVFGGLFIVPLNALIQFHAPHNQLGTVLAGNNWIQNISMLSFLILTSAFAYWGLESIQLFYVLILVALFGAVYTVYKLPQSLIRLILTVIFSGRYRVKVMGLDNLPAEGGVLLLGNHISWLDWAVIQMASPRPVRFVMDKGIYQRWYLKRFLDLFGVIPISAGQSKQALQDINNLLKAGEAVCLFPEGTISRNGQLSEFKKGFEKTVEDVDGVIVPFYLRGLWGSQFSRSNNHLQEQMNDGMRRDLIVAFGQPISIDSKADEVKRAVTDLSIHTWQTYTESLPPIAHAFVDKVKQSGSSFFLADSKGEPVNGYRALTGVLLFSRLLKQYSSEQNIGLLLPTTSAGVICNMAGLMLGRTLVNLNYTASNEAIAGAIDKAGIRTVFTSRLFIKKLQNKGIEIEPVLHTANVVYLEDLAKEISTAKKIFTMIQARLLPAWMIKGLYCKSVTLDQPAAILFSSGSEGTPKGVVLTHRNIMGNIKQITDMLDPVEKEVIMGSLPLFHAFGLTVTSLLPMVEGIPVVCHPDPTDVVNIGKAISRYKATVFCATSTFLRLFIRNRKVHPLMLESLRLTIAGAERLSQDVRDGYQQKFNKSIVEGYGTTETTPVASVNVPDKLDTNDWRVQVGNKLGTVGLPLPGSSFRIVDPNTLETLPNGEDGLILIGGTQVMQGYLNDPEKTQEVICELDGLRWYKSGDKGHLDADGFLVIVDRYSRFAKIGGEMISLGAVENAVGSLVSDEVEILATAIPDGKKGEQVVLLFAGDIDEAEFKGMIAASDVLPLMRPSRLLKVDAIPKLGSGKNDFNTAKKLALGE